MRTDKAKAIEEMTRAKYSGLSYDAQTITHLPGSHPENFSDKLLALRLDLVRIHATGKTLLDVCCANGEHLLAFRGDFENCIGVDFSAPFIEEAERRRASVKATNIRYVCSNVRDMPLKDSSIGTAYTFSSLYHIPEVEEVLTEVGRVLESGGIYIFDLGNLSSLNTVVCRAYPELADSCHIPVSEMIDAIRSAGFEIVEHRRFQFFPLWGDRPRWLKLFLHPAIEKIMRKEVRGKMLDEWLSSAPIFRNFAFRHIFVCKKL